MARSRRRNEVEVFHIDYLISALLPDDQKAVVFKAGGYASDPFVAMTFE